MDRARWVARLTASVLRLPASLPLALLALLALSLLLLVAAIPIPQLRQALGTLQRQIAAIVGDSYILVTRPIESASMVGQVGRDLAWLAQTVGGGDLAILAHSQGAAMTYDALREAPPPNLRLLFTLGSGMRKLEELRNLLGRGGYLKKAMALTLTGLVVGALYSWALLRAFVHGDLTAAVPGRTPAAAVHDFFAALMLVPFAVGGLALTVAGLWDSVQGMDLTRLRRRVDRFARSGVRWVDCFATKDPVPNGPLLESPLDPEAGEAPNSPSPVEVCNQRSTSADHTAYWRNRDEFVSHVVAELTRKSTDKERILKPEPAWGDAVAPRRRWRVRWLAAIRWLAWAGAALAVAVEWSSWRSLISWSMRRAGDWLAGLVGKAPSGARAALELVALWPALSALLFAIVPALAARYCWQRWDVEEMRSAIRGGRSRGIPAWPLLWVSGQVTGAAWIASRVDRLPWLPPTVAGVGALVVIWLAVTQPSPLPPAPAFTAPAPVSHAGCAFKLLFGIFTIFTMTYPWLESTALAAVSASWWKLGGLLLLAAAVVGLMIVGSVKSRKR
jgi:hypothetical protein